MKLPYATGDVEGALAVQNDFAIGSGFSVADKITCNDEQYGFVVGGDSAWASGALMCALPAPELNDTSTFLRWAVGGSSTGSALKFDANGYDNALPLPVDIADACATADLKCSMLSDVHHLRAEFGDDNVFEGTASPLSDTLEGRNTVIMPLDGTKRVNIVNIPASLLHEDIVSLSFESETSGFISIVVVNVIQDGDFKVHIQGALTLDGGQLELSQAKHFLWTMCSVDDVLMRNIDFRGSLLAPSTELDARSIGVLNGVAVIQGYSGNGIAHASDDSHAAVQFNINKFHGCPCLDESSTGDEADGFTVARFLSSHSDLESSAAQTHPMLGASVFNSVIMASMMSYMIFFL